MVANAVKFYLDGRFLKVVEVMEEDAEDRTK